MSDNKISNEEMFAYIVTGIIVLLGVVAYFKPAFFITPWSYIKLAEVTVLHYLSMLIPMESAAKFEVIYNGLLARSPSELTYEVMFKIENTIESYIRFVYAVPLALMGFAVSRFTPIKSVKGKTFESLLKKESEVWRFNRFFLRHNPSKQLDITKGRWAIRQKPEAFLRGNKFIKKVMTKDENDQPVAAKEICKNKLRKKLINQLGPTFKGFNKLEKHERWLVASFMARLADKPKVAEKLLGDIGYAYNKEYSFSDVNSEADDIIKKYENLPAVQKAVKGHAYVNTVILSLLMSSRDFGVNPTCLTPWLKLKDRTLWYMLNDPIILGEDGGTYIRGSAESAACRGHYLTEKHAGRGVIEPYVENVIKSFRAYSLDIGVIDQ